MNVRERVIEGIALQRRGDLAGAEREYLAALAVDPDDFDAQHMLGALKLAQGAAEQAATWIAKAVARTPGSALAHFNLGLAHAALGAHGAALGSFESAISRRRPFAEAWNSRGNALVALGRTEEARASYAEAVDLRPDYPAALANLATREQRAGELDAALAHLSRAYSLSAEPFVLGKLLDASYHACDWRALGALERRFSGAAGNAQPPPEPFTLLRSSSDPAEQQRRARQWAGQWTPLMPPRRLPSRPLANRALRVAYLSSDFYSHATARLLVGVLEAHDRRRLEPVAVSWSRADGSPLRQRILGAFAEQLDVTGLTDAQVAAQIQRLNIDVAVDLKGYTDGARPGILARCPAPVQVSWLGYPATLGAPWIDYFIADETSLPEPMQRHFDERILYLAGSYQPNDRSRIELTGSASRAENGLPPAGFVFASFNNSYKIDAEIFAVWLRLVRAIPGSVLWLFADNAAARRNLGEAAARGGVGPERVVFAGRVPADQHLRRQSCADLVLDTQPCAAHTTASDALAAGVPLVTIAGSTFAGRVAMGILEAAGLPELVAADRAEYERVALQLARDPADHGRVRARVAAVRAGSGIWDAAAFCRRLEAGLCHAAELAARDVAPRTFRVSREGGIDPDLNPARARGTSPT